MKAAPRRRLNVQERARGEASLRRPAADNVERNDPVVERCKEIEHAVFRSFGASEQITKNVLQVVAQPDVGLPSAVVHPIHVPQPLLERREVVEMSTLAIAYRNR